MILEQSFFALPEFLVGAGFVDYESEGTLVMSYAMAALQELNGRGVDNPIRELRGEVNYPNLNNRSADIHLNYERIGLLSESLGMYGVRRDNWLEAKFFRKNSQQKPTLPKVNGAHALLRDLIRLCVFVPEPNLGSTPAPSTSGRYLLHVYEGTPTEHLAFEKNAKKRRAPRGWLSKLHVAGPQTLPADNLSTEPPTSFRANVGAPLTDLRLRLHVENLVIAAKGSRYTLCLSRIDQFVLERAGLEISVQLGQCFESAPNAWNNLRAQIDSDLAK